MDKFCNGLDKLVLNKVKVLPELSPLVPKFSPELKTNQSSCLCFLSVFFINLPSKKRLGIYMVRINGLLRLYYFSGGAY